MSYRPPELEKLKEALVANGPSVLGQKYVIGDPLIVAENLLPICFISKARTGVQRHTNVEDRHNMQVTLTVVHNFLKNIDTSTMVQPGTADLYELVEARNADYTLKSDSLLGVLRDNTVLDGDTLYIDVGTEPEVQYQLSPPQVRGIFSVEATITITLRNHQIRSS